MAINAVFQISGLPPEWSHIRSSHTHILWPTFVNHVVDIHPSDTSSAQRYLVLSGARLADVVQSFVTAVTLEQLMCVNHPTRANSVNPEEIDQHMSKLLQVVTENRDKVVAIGECGLD